VVDDNSPSRELLALLFRSAGAAVDEAANGAEAVDRCETDNYDVVLMDVQMPLMDGLEATMAIRAKESSLGNRPQPLIVAVTAHAMDEHLRACVAAGMDDVITKPIDPTTVVADVARLLEEH
jgi:CheY-like chemotaxis protein